MPSEEVHPQEYWLTDRGWSYIDHCTDSRIGFLTRSESKGINRRYHATDMRDPVLSLSDDRPCQQEKGAYDEHGPDHQYPDQYPRTPATLPYSRQILLSFQFLLRWDVVVHEEHGASHLLDIVHFRFRTFEIVRPIQGPVYPDAVIVGPRMYGQSDGFAELTDTREQYHRRILIIVSAGRSAGPVQY